MINDLIAGWTELQDALPGYLEAERYYEGDVDEVFANPVARAAIARTGERYRFNLAKTPVNVMADRVEIASIIAPDSDAVSQTIEDIWDANDMAVHYPDLFRMSFEYGDAYLQVWPVEEEQGDDDVMVADDTLRRVRVELTSHHPKNCRVVYDPENPRRKAFVLKRWPVRDDATTRWRVDLYYPDRIERWVSLPNVNPNTVDAWQPFLDADQDINDWEIENPYGEIPFFHYRTGLPYGVPEHAAGYSTQDALNKLLITQLTTTDSHGWPQRWALTEAGAELDQAGDGPNWEDDTDLDEGGVEHPLGIPSAMKSGPGTIMDLVGKRAVGQFEAADPGVFLEPATFYIRLMAQMTTTPLHYFDPSGDVPSGESLKVADAPLTKKVERREAMFKSPIQETWLFALMLLGQTVDRLDIRWVPVEASAGKTDWEIAQAKQDAGVPRHQALVETGYEAEQVEQWMADEGSALDLVRRVELIGLMADAIQRLGSGVGLGVLSPEQASAIIDRIVGEAIAADAA